MGTKNNPGRFDCYERAEPDEPMFVLLGRDPSAWMLVSLWADLRERLHEDPAKVAEARKCVQSMLQWAVGRDAAHVDVEKAEFSNMLYERYRWLAEHD